MSNVQLAIQDERYAAALADLLKNDGSRHVAVVERPDLNIDGIIVIDGSRPENILLLMTQPERFVVITRMDVALLSKIWDAGVRHVVFEGDSPATTLLAVIAAELRALHLHDSPSLPAVRAAE